ncbi:hypothetical protein J2TS6_22700 [Paenibacillus albilobatus]|uniref:Uncharacterized protein n=2 Tax=Paenibacillus TaxID=44249 RepID=A0A919XEK3_9BACL|nr:hypothetical protein J2TS6_22700 [Paenibacillus albilobatus]
MPLNIERMFAYNKNKRSCKGVVLMPIKCVGQIVEIVYLDRTGKITQRKIEVKGIRDGIVRAICLTSTAPRTFWAENILAWKPVPKGERRPNAC